MKTTAIRTMATVLVALFSLYANAYHYVRINGIYYKLTSEEGVAEVSRGEFKYMDRCIIPSTVNNDGINYIVTTIGKEAFSNCGDLTSVIIPNSVTSIGDAAFYNTGLTFITIPKSVKSIGKQAFSRSNLTSITIPNSVTTIGSRAFADCCGLTSVAIPNSVKSIGVSAFSGCSVLISAPIPNSITSIEEGAFKGCTGLTSVTIPNSVKSIGGNAFSDCKGLTSVTIPNSVNSIEESAFSGCTGLKSITIPDNVTSIEDYAFHNCEKLDTIHCLCTDPPVIHDDSFDEHTYTASTLFVPKGSIEAYRKANGWKQFKRIEEEKNDEIF